MYLQIFEKDSRNMSEVSTGSINMVLTSPPYWDIVDYGDCNQLGKGLTYKIFLKFLQENLLECMRVVNEDGFITIIVGDVRKKANYSDKDGRPKLYSIHADIINFFIEMEFDFYQHFIWKKLGINKKGKFPYGSTTKEFAYPPYLYTDLLIEHILVFRKPGRKRELPTYSERSVMDRIPIETAKEWLDPVWTIDSPTHPLHPATCSPEVIRRLLQLFSLENDVILDPFAGIGTTAHIALELNRNVIAYELKKDYVQEIVNKYPTLMKDGHRYHGEVSLTHQICLFPDHNYR